MPGSTNTRLVSVALVLPLAVHRLVEPGLNVVYATFMPTLVQLPPFRVPWWLLTAAATVPALLVAIALVGAILRPASRARPWITLAIFAGLIETLLFIGFGARAHFLASNVSLFPDGYAIPAMAPQVAAHALPAAEAFFAAAVAARHRSFAIAAAGVLVLTGAAAEAGQAWRSQVFWGAAFAYDHIHSQVLLHLCLIPFALLGGFLVVRAPDAA